MGYGADGLTFRGLRLANLARLPEFKNVHGGTAHTLSDGFDWSLTDWCTAVAGELGEAANLIKKERRGDLTLEQVRPALADELADVAIYLDLLSHRAGIDLGIAIREKWNKTSEKIGSGLYIGSDGDYHRSMKP